MTYLLEFTIYDFGPGMRRHNKQDTMLVYALNYEEAVQKLKASIEDDCCSISNIENKTIL